MGKIRGVILTFASVVVFSTTCLLLGTQEANATAPEGSAYGDLLARIEALESRPTGNVTAPDIRGVKIGMDIRHRFEIRDMMIRDGQEISTGTAPGTRGDLGNVTRLANGTLQRSAGLGTLTGATQTNVGRDETTDFTLQWARISLDADVSDNVRARIMLQDARTFGEEGSTIGNLQRTDVQEGYVELRNLGNISSILKNIELRGGRWQAAYGDHRLIGNLPWANQTRAYDGARLRWDNKKGHWIDVFAWQINEKESGVANGGNLGTSDSEDDIEEVFYGFYSHFKVCDGVEFEPYGLVRARSREDTEPADNTISLTSAGNRIASSTLGVGTGEQRYTAGFRMHGSQIPGLGGTDFTIEPAWQFGHTEGLRTIDIGNLARGYNTTVTNDIQAWAIHAEIGYTFVNTMWSPRIGYAYSFASGDSRPGEGAVKTFDHLYPTGHAHNGYMDLVGWQNIVDHQIHLSARPSKKLVLDAKLHFMSLDEEADNMYGVAGGTGYGGGMSIVRQGSDSYVQNGVVRDVDNTLGQELDLTFSYQMFKNFNVVGGYSHFWADDWIQDTGSGVDRGVDWAYLMTNVKF
ncbi:MAG: alginate export family protein [Candidatus Scalindua sp.]|nr:alginate export family protein [Candidatus Scalindua sp.]